MDKQRNSLTCSNCGSADIDTEPSRGDSVCINCGSVVEDTLIVSEIGFQEDNHGGISTLGTFVNDDGMIRTAFGSRKHGGDKYSIHSNSSQTTLAKAKTDLAKLASKLKINSQCVDTAHNFYKLCLFKGLTRGRRHPLLYGALMYLVCRLEGTTHLLLDFSDTLCVSVFELGKLYLKLSAALCINAPITDPALYIPRFAQKLELGSSTHEVSMTAVRLVSRMKKDWIHCGRRPSGLCGAALLVAARLHNFNRTTRELVNIVRVRETTLKKRLKEFAATPSAALSLTEFFEIDLEEECDPPAFTQSKARHQQAQLLGVTNLWENQLPEVTEEIKKVQTEIETELEKGRSYRTKVIKDPVGCNDDMDLKSIDEAELACKLLNQQTLAQVLTEEHCVTFNSETKDSPSTSQSPDKSNYNIPKCALGILDNVIDTSKSNEGEPDHLAPLKGILDFTQKTRRKKSNKKSVFIEIDEADEETGELLIPAATCDDEGDNNIAKVEWRDDFKDLEDDREIEAMIMTPQEVQVRTKLFEAEFGEFLRSRAQAKADKAAAAAKLNYENGILGDELDDLEDKKPTAFASKANRKRGIAIEENSENLTNNNSSLVVKNARRVKKLSAKINYEVLRDLDLLDNKASNNVNNTNNNAASQKTTLKPPTTPTNDNKKFGKPNSLQQPATLNSRFNLGNNANKLKPEKFTSLVKPKRNLNFPSTTAFNNSPSIPSPSKRVRFAGHSESNDKSIPIADGTLTPENNSIETLKTEIKSHDVPLNKSKSFKTPEIISIDLEIQDKQSTPEIISIELEDVNKTEPDVYPLLEETCAPTYDREDDEEDEMLGAAQLLAQMRNGGIDQVEDDDIYSNTHNLSFETEDYEE